MNAVFTSSNIVAASVGSSGLSVPNLSSIVDEPHCMRGSSSSLDRLYLIFPPPIGGGALFGIMLVCLYAGVSIMVRVLSNTTNFNPKG